jgi:hypothetical protein
VVDFDWDVIRFSLVRGLERGDRWLDESIDGVSVCDIYSEP